MKLSHKRSLFAALCLLAAAGCRQDMHNQPKAIPLRESMFFKNTPNTSSARPLVEGTVARGTLQDDAAFFTGKNGAAEVDALPFALTAEVLDRGQQRYGIYCTPCHGLTGQGDGMIVRRGYRQPPSYHSDRLRQIPIGHFYDVMTNGFGAMPDYAAQTSVRDRWAIAAYIRALQLSQHARVDDVPAAEREKLSTSTVPSGGGAPRD
jgi:mono/diheme cytochrome c family protein